MSEALKCTCDAFCDAPCPVHARENALQDELIKLRKQLADYEGVGATGVHERCRLETLEEVVAYLRNEGATEAAHIITVLMVRSGWHWDVEQRRWDKP